MDEDEKRYPLTYDIRPENPPLTKSEVLAQERAAADAVVLLSMIYPPDGSFSLMIESLDGRYDSPVSEEDLFKVWFMVASRLAASLGPGWRRDLARKVIARVREHVVGPGGGHN